MSTDRDEIIDAALKLSEADRLMVVARLLETLPEEFPGLSADDPGFLEELERRANERGPVVPVSDLWKEE